MFKILKKEEMAQGTIISNVIFAPKIAAKAQPGQFVMIRANKTGERIPLTMAEHDPKAGTITIIYQLVGKSTKLFATLNVGDSFLDVAGPLGTPTEIKKLSKSVIVVGGGTGIAVVHNITKGFKKAGNHIISILGSRNKELIILEDKMFKISDQNIICTDDGSYGRKGFVTEALKEILENNKNIGLIVMSGPAIMMKMVTKIAADYNIKALASLNAIMIDATGMCGCCRVSINGQTKLTCLDGPEFDAHLVNWDEFIKRLSAYQVEEKQADHLCQIGRSRS